MVARAEGALLPYNPFSRVIFHWWLLQEANCRRERSLFGILRSGATIYSSSNSSSLFNTSWKTLIFFLQIVPVTAENLMFHEWYVYVGGVIHSNWLSWFCVLAVKMLHMYDLPAHCIVWGANDANRSVVSRHRGCMFQKKLIRDSPETKFNILVLLWFKEVF